MKFLKSLPVAAYIFVQLTATAQTDNFTQLRKGFKLPPDSVKPSVYWYWMSDNISRDGVIKDLTAMDSVGIGRAFIGNIGYPKEEVPYGSVKLFSDRWWQIMKTAISTATSKGIDIGIFNSPGWSQSGGPWIAPYQSMRYVAFKEYRTHGAKKVIYQFPLQKNFQQIVVQAFRAPSIAPVELHSLQPVVESDPSFNNAANMADGDISTVARPNSDISSKTILQIDLRASRAVTVRSLELFGSDSWKADVELQVKRSGNYSGIRKFEYDRSNLQLNVGFAPLAPVCISFDAAEGSEFRLVLSRIQGKPAIAEILLSSAAKIERYPEKQLAKMFQTPLPLWNEYKWPAQSGDVDRNMIIQPSDVIDITRFVNPRGQLSWLAPAGEWIIIQSGMMPTGVTNSPASPEGIGSEVDKINHKHLQHHFDSFAGKVIASMPAKDRTSLKWLVADSYETGSQNWTDGFESDFRKTFGYDPLPWLPSMTGRIIGSADQCNRFLWDLRRFVADRVAYEYVGGLRKISHNNGMKLWLENYGHWGYPSEFLTYGGQADEVAGEFWNEGTLGDIECRAASSAAHIYGKNKVAAESFTAGGKAYQRYLALLKKRGDWSFTEGINHTLLHVFITQPYDSLPGVNAGFGTEFNRNNTWFYMGKAFVDYLRRCNLLLQQGRSVNDIAYFIGEDAPAMTGIRRPEIPGGYSYDYINAEVLLTRAFVKDSMLMLPGGSCYQLLILPELETMRPELLRKIETLINAGARVMGPRPLRSPGLAGYPQADKEVQEIATRLWDTTGPSNSRVKVYATQPLKPFLIALAIMPDAELGSTDVLYTHRTTSQEEIYFLSNQSAYAEIFQPIFRVQNKQPWWFDAVTGEARILPAYENVDGRTKVPVTLEALQSGFIIFKQKAKSDNLVEGSTNFPRPYQTIPLKNPWTVQFAKDSRGPVSPVVFPVLTDWSKHDNDSIRNYSGTAIYRTGFNMEDFEDDTNGSAYSKIRLDLGDLVAMGKIRINGKELGTVWTPPYSIEIGHVLKKGENVIEVEVVNTWVNRLIGDSKLPQQERKTWSNVNNYSPASHYEPAGLLGPVRLELYK